MAKEQAIVVDGVVLESSGNGIFRVELPGKHVIVAHPSGKMRMHKINILPGDDVTCEMSPYDMSRGRIVKRTINR